MTAGRAHLIYVHGMMAGGTCGFCLCTVHGGSFFLYPGLALVGFGIVGTTLLLPGPVMIGNVGIDIHTFIVTSMSILVGLQSVGFAVVVQRYGLRTGFIPQERYARALQAITLERLLIVALVMFLVGIVGVVWCVAVWASTGFGPLSYAALLRVLVLSLTAVSAGIQLAFTAFLAGIMEIPVTR